MPARVERWLELRAIEHERPKAIWELGCEHLLAERIVRPPVDALVRMIGAARERAYTTTHELLSAQLQDARLKDLDRLLELRAPGDMSGLRVRARGYMSEVFRGLRTDPSGNWD